MKSHQQCKLIFVALKKNVTINKDLKLLPYKGYMKWLYRVHEKSYIWQGTCKVASIIKFSWTYVIRSSPGTHSLYD